MERDHPQPIPITKAHSKPTRAEAPEWDLERVGRRLHSHPSPIDDPEYGPGQLFLIGVDQPLIGLELYPETATARLYSEEVTLELLQIDAPKLADNDQPIHRESVLLEGLASPSLRLSLSAEGAVTLFLQPTEELKLYRPKAEVQRNQHGSEASKPLELPRESPQPRVSLDGRVGSVPVFDTTGTGRRIGRFPLAVHQGEETLWHRVLVFGPLAERLNGTLQKGQRVQVVGYRHQRERQGRDGSKRLVDEVYAVAVRQPAGQSADR